MKYLLLLTMLSCSHLQPSQPVPSWVSSLRSGEERLKLVMGSRMMFRRIAGAKYQSSDQACQTAIKRAEGDIRNEYPHLEHVPYTLETMFYDPNHGDCAVTLSANPSAVAPAPNSKVVQARSIARSRSDIAEQYAISGLTDDEFTAYTKEPVYVDHYYKHPCSQYFGAGYSEHGATSVCWKRLQVVGYCRDGICLSK